MQSNTIDDQTREQLLNEAFTQHLSNRPYTANIIAGFSRRLYDAYDNDDFKQLINSPEELEKAMREHLIDSRYTPAIRNGYRTEIQGNKLEEKFAQYCAEAVLPSRMSNEDFDKLDLGDFLNVFYKANKEEIEKADKDPAGERNMI